VGKHELEGLCSRKGNWASVGMKEREGIFDTGGELIKGGGNREIRSPEIGNQH